MFQLVWREAGRISHRKQKAFGWSTTLPNFFFFLLLPFHSLIVSRQSWCLYQKEWNDVAHLYPLASPMELLYCDEFRAIWPSPNDYDFLPPFCSYLESHYRSNNIISYAYTAPAVLSIRIFCTSAVQGMPTRDSVSPLPATWCLYIFMRRRELLDVWICLPST